MDMSRRGPVAFRSSGTRKMPRATASAAGRQCIYAPNISGFRRGAGDTVVVNTNSRDYYEFRTQAYCADRLDWPAKPGGDWPLRISSGAGFRPSERDAGNSDVRALAAWIAVR